MLELLGEASLRALAMAAATALTLALFRIGDARVRHAAWTGVLLLMIASPAALTGGIRARIPIRAPEPILRVIGANPAAAERPGQPTAVPVPDSGSRPRLRSWRGIALAAYVLVAAALLARVAVGIRRVSHLVRTASAGPGYLTHPACVAPMAVGWLRPRVILPVRCSEWPADRLAMVLAHEAVHVRRRDSIVRLIALVNRAIFWFHPLAWWLHRELATLAEEVCDAAVASRHGRTAYAECLLATARESRRSGRWIESPVDAMAARALPRRIGALIASPRPLGPRRRRWMLGVWATVLVACLTLTPTATLANLRVGSPGSEGLGGFVGTFVVIDDSDAFEFRHDAVRADRRVSPCSTFKLPFAAMLLETGVVDGPDTIVKYRRASAGSLQASQEQSAHDQTLTSAFRESANWYFDLLSRSLPGDVVKRFTTRSAYGNADVPGSTGHGSYWYDGRLLISANEQVRFLRRLHNGDLGLSARTTELVKQIAEVEVTPRWRLAAKTGACRASGEETTINWYVGWVEKPAHTYYFALQFEADSLARGLNERIPIARRLLADLRILD